MGRPEKIRLGEILVQQKLLTEEQLTLALAEQKKSGRRLGRIVIEKSLVREEQISEALARQLNIPYVNLKHYNIKREIILKLPESAARRFRALVLDDDGTTYKVGMADPTDVTAYDEIVRILRRNIDIVVVLGSELMPAIDRIYRRTEQITGLAQELKAELGETAAVDFGALALTPGLEEAPVVKLLQTVFEDAVQARASDIHIEPHEQRLQIRFRIDGVLNPQTEADAKIASAVALRLKLMSGLDISEKRLPQDGRFPVKVRNAQIDVRISTMPTQYGESVVMRLLNQASGLLGLDHVGMPKTMVAKVREVIHRQSGLILVTGPTGSGKTTTLYAALTELNTPERKIVTVEDPVEYRLQGINQVQVNEKIDLTFDRVLRSALRQDPDVILVGEMRDHPTVETGLRAAMTGHVVLSTLHTNDAVSSPVRLLDMGAARYMVALSLQLVLAQRLVRLICDSCTKKYKLLPNEHEWLRHELGDEVDKQPYLHGEGCPHCNGTGYQGRTGVYEMLEMTGAVVEAADQDDVQHFVRIARDQMGTGTLRRHAARLVAAGKTTVQEAMRVTQQFED
ncbi:MAG: GspE/PulE family protein [Betaproteobacteria bacterium]|nr:GspE/PulE family protein [Betaproteobacteria bacterium]MDH3436798.1 GspE/PulE family protein [Betaproteobacteria bacterium]